MLVCTCHRCTISLLVLSVSCCGAMSVCVARGRVSWRAVIASWRVVLCGASRLRLAIFMLVLTGVMHNVLDVATRRRHGSGKFARGYYYPEQIKSESSENAGFNTWWIRHYGPRNMNRDFRIVSFLVIFIMEKTSAWLNEYYYMSCRWMHGWIDAPMNE